METAWVMIETAGALQEPVSMSKRASCTLSAILNQESTTKITMVMARMEESMVSVLVLR